jgi:hypothetical protein
LIRDIVALQQHPKAIGSEYSTPPLVLCNNFTVANKKELQLMNVIFQKLFPPINIQTVPFASLTLYSFVLYGLRFVFDQGKTLRLSKGCAPEL